MVLQANISSIVRLADLNYTHAGASDVFDVWAGVALPPLQAGTATVHTPAINRTTNLFINDHTLNGDNGLHCYVYNDHTLNSNGDNGLYYYVTTSIH